jgi:PAS domain S-box-containing protein
MNVLLADKDFMSRHVIMQTLAHTNLAISCAQNGAEAWQKLETPEPPRLLVLDWNLSEPDGLEICRKIREQRSPDYTYIILLSSRANKSDMLVALAAGVDDYVTKPINRDEFLARISLARRFLEKEAGLTRIARGWRCMLDNIPFGVAALSRTGDVVRANKVIAEQLGLDLKAMLGKNLMPTTIRRTEDLVKLRQSIKQAEPFDRIEMDTVRSDGEKHRLIVWGRPLKEGGEIVYQIITEED